MSERGKRLLRSSVEALNLPTDRAAGLAVTELTGCGRLTIENHRGIVEYGSERVSILTRDMTICITGEGLELTAMNDRSLMLVGEIGEIRFVK